MDDEIDRGFLTRLRKLIGRKCTYLGKDCLLIDLLSEEGVLILEAQERLPPIQTDQYGQATCRSNELLQVPIFGNDETSFSEEIMDLLASLSNGEKNRKPAPLLPVGDRSHYDGPHDPARPSTHLPHQ